MPKLVTIICDGCGLRFLGGNYSKLMRTLRQLGWSKGQEQGTYYCPTPACQQRRADADERHTRKKTSRRKIQ